MKKLSFVLLALTVHSAQAAYLSGFYINGALGGTLLDVEVDQHFSFGTPATISIPSEINLSDGNVAGWIGVGYSHRFQNHLVLGAEVTAGATNLTVSHKNGFVPEFDDFIDGEIESQLSNDFAALFKVGYLSKHNTYLYALVGPRWGNFESTLDTSIPPFLFTDSESGYQLGVTAGVGIEHMINNHLALGLEYAYTSYGQIDSPRTLVQAEGATILDEADLEASTNTLGVRLSYHF